MSASRPRRVAITIAGLALATALALVARAMRPRPPLPVYGEVPGFTLVDSRGAPFGDATMRGHVSVVDFIFTRCPSSCPRLTARMGALQSRLAAADPGGDVRLVSFSVDPENDTPPVLAEYAGKAHDDPARWTFVTGPLEAVQGTAVQGFKVSAAKTSQSRAAPKVLASARKLSRKASLCGESRSGRNAEKAARSRRSATRI